MYESYTKIFVPSKCKKRSWNIVFFSIFIFLYILKYTIMSNAYMGAGGELSRISPPEKFWFEIPPFERGTLWQNIPPLQKCFQQNIQRVPPQIKIFSEIFRKFQNFGLELSRISPPLRTKNLSPPKNFFPKYSPPSKIFKSLPPTSSGARPCMRTMIIFVECFAKKKQV